MKEAIREKINELINKGIESEAECVYLLSKIRKYMEQQSIFDYHNLYLCMNWALHSSIDRGPVKALLKEIEDFLDSIDDVTESLSFEGFEELQNKLLFVQPLEVELLEFLETHGFETSICKDKGRYCLVLKKLYRFNH